MPPARAPSATRCGRFSMPWARTAGNWFPSPRIRCRSDCFSSARWWTQRREVARAGPARVLRTAVKTIARRATATFSEFDHHHSHAQDNQGRADGFLRFESLAKKNHRQDNRNRHAQFIDRRDLGHVAQFQGAEIAEPRKPGHQPRRREEKPGAGGHRRPARLATGRKGKYPGHAEDY